MTAMTVPPPPPPPSVWTMVVSLSRSGSVMGASPYRFGGPTLRLPAGSCNASGFGQEVRHREVALARVVVEGEDALPRTDLVQLLLHGGEAGARADADEHAFLARRAPGHFLGIVGIDQDHAVDRVGVEVGGDKAGADALDRVGAGLAARDDRRQSGLDGEYLEVRPFLLQHFRAGGDVAAGADAGDDDVDGRVAEIVQDFLRGGADVDVDVRRILELLGDPAALGLRGELLGAAIAAFMPPSLGVRSNVA